MAVDPLAVFHEWFEDARAAGVGAPEAMTLATADADGRPSARMLLLKSADERGFTFFSGYESRKGRELAENPRAALVFYWRPLGRQVRVEGTVRRLSAEESDAYWATRPPRSRAAAAASRQSEPIDEPRRARGRVRAAPPRRRGAEPGPLGRLRARAGGDRALAAPRRPPARTRQVHARARGLGRRTTGAVVHSGRCGASEPRSECRPWRSSRRLQLTAESSGDKLVAILLAMAMFVLVVDTSLMNVSISAVVHDLDTTASGVQSAIALEALVSAAFILIGSKIGDLFGRKRAYILGLLGYAAGALSMTLSQSLRPDHHLLGDHRRPRCVAPAPGDAVPDPRQLPGTDAAAGLRAGRSRGGYRRCRGAAPRRLHHDLSLLARRLRRGGLIIALVLLGSGRVHDVPYTGSRGVDFVGADPLGRRDERRRAGDPRLAGRRRRGRRADRGRPRLARNARVVAQEAQARGQAGAARRRSLRVEVLPARDLVPDPAADLARRADDRAPDLPPDGARVQRAARQGYRWHRSR